MDSDPPHSGSPTSMLAAQKIKPDAKVLRAIVFDAIVRGGSFGATDLEIQDECGLSGDTQRPRRWELVNAGLVFDSGITRKTPSNRDAIVWVGPQFKPTKQESDNGANG